jgi:hypothetical protein
LAQILTSSFARTRLSEPKRVAEIKASLTYAESGYSQAQCPLKICPS